MKVTISQLTSTDLDSVDELMKRDNKTLGFLTRETLLKAYLNKGGGLGAKTKDDKLIGYLLYGAYPDRFRIAQLCVSEDFRGQDIAKRLLEELKGSATTQKVIKLRCRRDFPANDIWPRLGFVALNEKPGRSKYGHLLTLWCLTLALDDQLGLFQAKTSDETLDVIIDAQIFFDFYELDSDKSRTSKALLSDFLVDSLNICITDELFNEIDRHKIPEQREKSRVRSQRFFQINPKPDLVEGFDKLLRKLLPSRKPSQESDIRQLAKAAASDVGIFVTRDRDLLKKSKDIAAQTGLQILAPTDLIIQLHELYEKQSYTPNLIAGLNLRWQRLTSDELASLPYESFIGYKEKRSRFRTRLESLVAQPNHYKCEILRSRGEIIAIRVLKSNSKETLTVSLTRVALSVDLSLFGRFLISDTISRAVENDMSMVKFEASTLLPSMIQDLSYMGFKQCSDSFVRFCFSRYLDREEVLSKISLLCTKAKNNYQDMSNFDLERHCSPLSLMENQNHFLIPIRPGYALNLVDYHQSADDLFGGKPDLLLRWDNVYYRKKTRHKMLKAPGRILWYVSGTIGQIVAVSHLDSVVIDTPKELLRQFKKFGTLEWKDLFEMCEGDISRELMALKFSHTFPFRKPISLKAIRTVFKEDDVKLSLQSPLKIPAKRFWKLFQLGYPIQV